MTQTQQSDWNLGSWIINELRSVSQNCTDLVGFCCLLHLDNRQYVKDQKQSESNVAVSQTDGSQNNCFIYQDLS